MVSGHPDSSPAAQAVRVAGIAATAPFRYTIIAWSLILGWTVFGFIPDFPAFIGFVMIAGSGLYTILEQP